MDLDVMEVGQVPRARPELTLLAAAPKGDRLEGMIDGLSQVGVGTWSPLLSERTVVEPRAGKLERLHRVAIEAMKQCGRAWLLEIGESVGFDTALAGRVVMADASGAPYQRTGAEKLTLLIGPEGGWSEAELATARVAGVQVARFGVHTMRTETAAMVAAAVVMEVER
jgi:16S rRNA (uracil1498-N3)-methyltransferase